MKSKVNPIHAFISYLTALVVFPLIIGTTLIITFNTDITNLQEELNYD